MRNRGFTVIELLVTIGIVLSLSGLTMLTLRNAREPLTPTLAALRTTINDARAFARDNNGTGSGGVLVVTRDGAGSTVRLLVNRPLPGYDAPTLAAHRPPTTFPLPLTLENGVTSSFSLAIAPDGQLDVLRSIVVPNNAPIASAPGCGTDADPTVRITVGMAPHAGTLVLRCADATVLSAG